MVMATVARAMAMATRVAAQGPLALPTLLGLKLALAKKEGMDLND
jgi:hypothetical protein